MKKELNNWILAGFTLLLSITSCRDYLDFEYIFQDTINLDTIFLKKEYTEQWLSDVYYELQNGSNVIVASKGHQPFNFLADDMYFGDRQFRYAVYKNCWYTEGWDQGSWEANYSAIRRASIFIHNVDKNSEMTPEEILDNKGQARFLRAYYYWLLMRKYGPIPLLPDEGLDFTLSYDELAVARNTYEECAEFIATEMALAACEMTDKPRSEREIMRATPGAALAVRARAYLYAASPLFNGNNDDWAQRLVDDTGKPLVNIEYKEELWAKAAAAAKEVMDLGTYRLHTVKFRDQDVGIGFTKTVKPPHHDEYSTKAFPDGWEDIDPFESYREVFNGALNPSSHPELIFTRGQNVNTEGITVMVLHHLPRSLNGWNTHGVTLKHANTYYMADGGDFDAYGKEDPTDGRPATYGYTQSDDEVPFLRKDVSLEYAGREPRFYASIAFNGSYWECLNAPDNVMTERQAFYYRGLQDGMLTTNPEHYLRTGIGIKKFYHPRDYFEQNEIGYFKGQPKADVDIRYAEILLIYAEALNELKGSHTIPNYRGDGVITVNRNVEEMRKGMKPVRMRAGVPDFTADVYNNADAFRKALKRERQIELFAETHRYYDLRRWKDAEKEETQPTWGLNMTMREAQRDQFHRPILIPSLPHIFIDKMYLWPISHTELKRNKKLTQNPGWTYYD